MTLQEQASMALPQFDEWANVHCVFRDRCWGGIVLLHRHFTDFCSGRNPCTLEVFTWILRDQGFGLSDALVHGLVLAEDEPKAMPSKTVLELPKGPRVQWMSSPVQPGAPVEAISSRRASGSSSEAISTYYRGVLAGNDLRRQSSRNWTALCPEHAPGAEHILSLDFETGAFKCSDRSCDLAWGGRNIFHFEMARLRRETGSVPGCTLVARSIDRTIGMAEEGAA